MGSRVDVVIVGAGSAGAAAALLCARAGLSVRCIDAAPLDRAGARWLNGVPGWCFDVAGIARPEPPEDHGHSERYHLMAGYSQARVTVTERDCLDVDMRHLVARLQRLAIAAGATLEGRVRALGWSDGVLQTDNGAIEADVAVDASGLRRVLGGRRTGRVDLCTAAQEVRELVDPGGAEAFFGRWGVPVGDHLCFTGVAGGYSIVNVRVSGGQVSILTGAMASGEVPSGGKMLDGFVRDNPWIGGKLWGGRRAIPVGAPEAVHHGDVLRIGDSGGQVYATHGSGIGAQLLAARALADALARGEGAPGYGRRFERLIGRELERSAVFAEFSRSLTPSDLERMMAAGWLSRDTVVPALEQRPLAPSPKLARRVLGALWRDPTTARRIVPVLARMARTTGSAPVDER